MLDDELFILNRIKKKYSVHKRSSGWSLTDLFSARSQRTQLTKLNTFLKCINISIAFITKINDIPEQNKKEIQRS